MRRRTRISRRERDDQTSPVQAGVPARKHKRGSASQYLIDALRGRIEAGPDWRPSRHRQPAIGAAEGSTQPKKCACNSAVGHLIRRTCARHVRRGCSAPHSLPVKAPPCACCGADADASTPWSLGFGSLRPLSAFTAPPPCACTCSARQEGVRNAN